MCRKIEDASRCFELTYCLTVWCTNGMFVGDEQPTQCALVVLGKDDLVQAKKEMDRHQTVKQYVSSKHLDASSHNLEPRL